MKLGLILGAAAIACCATVPLTMAQAGTQGLIVLAEDDHHKDQHPQGGPKGPPPAGPAHGAGGPPHGGTPPTGPQGHGGQGQMGGPNHGAMGSHGQLGIPDHNPNTMGGDHRDRTGGQNHMGGNNTMMMSGHGATHQNFDRRTYQRNFNAPRRYRAGGYVRPHGWYDHRWVYGEILPALFWSQNYWLSDYFDYGLADPPPGFVWVRYGDDALLIDQNSGEVLQVEYGVFD
jgi:Ni/Co efflux regulator RcnB